MPEEIDFGTVFKRAMGDRYGPYPYQTRLATGDEVPGLLDVPTGLGKTAAVVLAWIYRRRFFSVSRPQTPRRLVYCLPMRTLVEQTFGDVNEWLVRLGLHTAGTEQRTKQAQNWAAKNGDLGEHAVDVHLLMGGERVHDWTVRPERDAILIGTQDMLLSRALNRGYGMTRYRWPMHFAMLNNDCLWVMDETQLMGNGLLTTAQLECFGHAWPREKPCAFIWMSATIGESFLHTADRDDLELTIGTPARLEDDDCEHTTVQERLQAEKNVEIARSCPSANRLVSEHQEGRITLAILNTVPSAKSLYTELQKQVGKDKRFKDKPKPEICLLHGRFRPLDRRRAFDKIAAFVARVDTKTGAVVDSPGLLIVSTQVIEAGFDISAVRLWSEIAPWASVVQRLGRLNREGKQPESSATFWMPKEDKDRENHKLSPNAKRIGPYDKPALQVALNLIEELVKAKSRDVPYRTALESVSATKAAKDAVEVTADVVIRPNDFHELFGTEADLDGGFTDVSHFVRGSDRNSDVQVFWRDLPNRFPQVDEAMPSRDELCSVPVFELRRFVSGKLGAFEWNPEARAWESRRVSEIHPGMTLLLSGASGGYSDELGWTGNLSDRPSLHQSDDPEPESRDSDLNSISPDWVSLTGHLADVEVEAVQLVRDLSLDKDFGKALTTAAAWHDWGKSLDRWQDAVASMVNAVRDKMHDILLDAKLARFHACIREFLTRWELPSDNAQWAKFPDVRQVIQGSRLSLEDRRDLTKRLYVPFRPNLRHEAASALAAWAAWRDGNQSLTGLTVYLIACHHGKVRTVLRRTRTNYEVFGLDSSDVLRSVERYFPEESSIQFACATIGASGTWDESNSIFHMTSPSWIQMVDELLGPAIPSDKQACGAATSSEPNNLGPFKLSYLEAILRAADIRASKAPGQGGQP